MANKSAKEKVAWIGAGSLVLVAIIYVFGAPMYDERPIGKVSFGIETGFPKDILQKEGDNYYIPTFWYNSGKSDIFSKLYYTGTNVKLSINTNGPWDYEITTNYMIELDDGPRHTKIFVSPDPDANQFKIEFNILIDQEQSPFQKLNPIIPSALTYEKLGNDYILIDAR